MDAHERTARLTRLPVQFGMAAAAEHREREGYGNNQICQLVPLVAAFPFAVNGLRVFRYKSTSLAVEQRGLSACSLLIWEYNDNHCDRRRRNVAHMHRRTHTRVKHAKQSQFNRTVLSSHAHLRFGGLGVRIPDVSIFFLRSPSRLARDGIRISPLQFTDGRTHTHTCDVFAREQFRALVYFASDYSARSLFNRAHRIARSHLRESFRRACVCVSAV